VKNALTVLRVSAESLSGAPLTRYSAAKHWAQYAFKYSESKLSSLEAYDTLIDLIPRIVWLGRTINQRYKDIGSIGTSINEAAAVACEIGRYDLALEWLEQGRSIVWNQMLRLRTPMD
jgi:hypothetical protein